MKCWGGGWGQAGKLSEMFKEKSDLTEIQSFRIPASSAVLPPVEQKITSPFRSFHLTNGYRWGPDVVKDSKTFVCAVSCFDLRDLQVDTYRWD